MDASQEEQRQLVERSRDGDREAFGELVGRHRLQAVQWARAIMKDAYWAEDVAQDALIRSYLQLEKLADPERFIPWLRTIVRNKALDVLRSGRRRGGLERSLAGAETAPDSDMPEIVALGKEWLESVTAMMDALPVRNRGIAEAFFFRRQTPEEIAETFGIAVGNVYNILSRSKLKLQEERFRRAAARNAQKSKATGREIRRVLPVPPCRSAYASLGHALHESFYGEYELCDVLGFTGQAFRIQTTADCGLSGSLIYDWGWALERSAAALGGKAMRIGRPGRAPTPDLLVQALDMIRQAIGQGTPPIVWNLNPAEFGLIYGYDDEPECFFYRDAAGRCSAIPYSKLGRTLDNPELFVGFIERPKRPAEPSLASALETIVRHARGREPAVPGYTAGLAAYAVWSEAFGRERAQPVGHAYQVALLTEAREQAVAFLCRWEKHPSVSADPETARLWREAADEYRTLLRTLGLLYPAFPYGMPGARLDIRERSVQLIAKAREAEERGIERLEQIFAGMAPRLDRFRSARTS
ncbi:RNA polymerase sigma factor [Cohnella zeiphila]|uniref:RNA polymerase sigma factor n=1 Tax=Cohnella zeiphila TaxID=2761120 RepID=A0A7X0VXP9_9BACL|nr:RNA polymerase sigma factor [Cohnella zeiphila]MBB6734211.1 RNA polymerase sigma factor [Cohnella zeiphila]